MKGAAHIVEIEVMNNRVVVAPIEPRAGIARYDAATDTFDLELTGQGVHGIRRQLAEFVFKLPPERIRLHAPDVGGGFGIKNFLYPEWILLLWAARRLGRPVRWVADRARGVRRPARRAATSPRRRGWRSTGTGRFLALDIEMVANLGAYLSGNGPGAAAVAGLDRAWAASTTFRRSRSTCAAPSPTPCRSTPIAAPASPRPTTSSSAASRRPRASSASIRPSCAGRT